MNYANGKEVKPGDHVVGRDCGGNIVTGPVMVTGLRGDNIRIAGVPLVVPTEDCLLCEDAYQAAMVPILEARAIAKVAELEAKAKADAAAEAAAGLAPVIPPATGGEAGSSSNPAPNAT